VQRYCFSINKAICRPEYFGSADFTIDSVDLVIHVFALTDNYLNYFFDKKIKELPLLRQSLFIIKTINPNIPSH